MPRPHFINWAEPGAGSRDDGDGDDDGVGD